MNIVVAGLGYVGTSMAVLLAQHNSVTAYDISEEKVKALNMRMSPIRDSEAEDFLKNKQLDIKATLERSCFENADYVIVATPTNYDTEKTILIPAQLKLYLNWSAGSIKMQLL